MALGVDYNTPGIIKYPFWQLTTQNPKATYACINVKQVYAPGEIAVQSICLQEDITAVLGRLLLAKKSLNESSLS